MFATVTVWIITNILDAFIICFLRERELVALDNFFWKGGGEFEADPSKFWEKEMTNTKYINL